MKIGAPCTQYIPDTPLFQAETLLPVPLEWPDLDSYPQLAHTIICY